MEKIRINKYLTEANYCSRREADKLIEQGRVWINDAPAPLGARVSPGDRVTVDEVEVKKSTEEIYLMYHKPVGIICTTDKTKPDNIIDALDYPERVYPIGRLDVATAGLILLTNDGSVVNAILRGENGVEKEYIVRADRTITEEDMAQLRIGVVIEGRKTRPAKVHALTPRTVSITIVEGKNRQVRNMMELLHYHVSALTRVRIGQIRLGSLPVGQYQKISKAYIKNRLGLK